MQQKRLVLLLIGVSLLVLLAGGSAILAQSSAAFHLVRRVVSGGGGASASTSYRVQGSIGQGVTSPPISASAGFTLTSGYWFAESRASASTIYLPVVRKE